MKASGCSYSIFPLKNAAVFFRKLSFMEWSLLEVGIFLVGNGCLCFLFLIKFNKDCVKNILIFETYVLLQ